MFCVLFYLFASIDASVEGVEEGEDFEVFQEEDQGQAAHQGKHLLDHVFVPLTLLCMVLLTYAHAFFYGITFMLLLLLTWYSQVLLLPSCRVNPPLIPIYPFSLVHDD